MSLHIFGDESGQVGGKHFLIGLLLVESDMVSEYERQLQKLKLEHDFRYRELHYNELTRLKTDFAKAVVDWYFSANEAIFKTTVVPGGIFDHRQYSGNMKFMSSEEMSYNVIYKLAINYHARDEQDGGRKVVIVDRKDKARPDEFERYIRANVSNVVDMQEVPSENHNLLQVVDLLAGCVNGDLNGVQSFHKRTVIDHIKARLGIISFRDRNAYTKEKFRVDFLSAKKTEKQRSPTSA